MRLIFVLLLGVLAWKVVDHHRSRRAYTDATAPIAEAVQPVAPLAQATPVLPVAASAYLCDGRTRCPQMQSCDEAKFFLKNCPGVQMDGDHDGIPCEQQWCERDKTH